MDLKEYAKRLEKAQKGIPKLMEEIALEIGNEFLQRVIERTPATNNNQLKNAWELEVTPKGNDYIITIKNETEYASLIEYGHKTAQGGFENGKFMLRITEREMMEKSDTIASKKLHKYLKDILG